MSGQHRKYWSAYSLSGIEIKVPPYNRKHFYPAPSDIPPHFWKDYYKHQSSPFPTHRGYSEARALIGHGTVTDIANLSARAVDCVTEAFSNTFVRPCEQTPPPLLLRLCRLVELRLCNDLQRWKDTRRATRHVLPPKQSGLTKVSDQILNILGAKDWPEALVTNNALFGCGLASLIIGAADAPTMFSNYVTDMAFYYEHGYDRVFPSLEPLLEKGLSDLWAAQSVGGAERRAAVRAGKRYIQRKISLEKCYKSSLAYRAAQLGCRRDAQIVCLSESSLLGMAAEAISRGYDAAAVMSDLVFSSPGTDVVDVGSDLLNSEVMNSFLNVADISGSGGVISENVLRRVYDAYAATGARMLTERWHEPVARMCAMLYTWHIQNDRHMFLRRAILGWPKARKKPAQPQREADFDEVFDDEYRTTGFWRPLNATYACDGLDTCDRVRDFFERNGQVALLHDLWLFLVVGPLEYVRGARIDERHEKELVEGSRVIMAQLFSRGFVLEMIWLIAHACHHAWQVNYLFEAAMFGSFLDGGELIGKLDRQDEDHLED